MIRKYTVPIGVLIFLGNIASANACDDVLPNTTKKVSAYRETACVNIKNVNLNDTYFVADSSIKKDGAYRIKIKNSSGTIILAEDISFAANQFVIAKKLNNIYSSDISISLQPLTSLVDYTYTVIHDENITTGSTTIYIGLQTVKSKAPRDPVEPRIQLNSTSFQMQAVSSSLSTAVSTSSIGEAAQCNDGNRPPTTAPVTQTGNTPLNVNNLLRTSKAWSQKMDQAFPHDIAAAAVFARAYVMHKYCGALDLSHEPDTDFKGSSSMGNFLYGANLRAMGMSTDYILSFSAAAQGRHGTDGSWFKGGVNFILNTGDNLGDPEEVMRGIKYHDEVFDKNQNDSNLLSCLDDESIDSYPEVAEEANDSGSNIGSGGGEGSGDLGNSGGYLGSGPSGGEAWCLVQSGTVRFCWYVATKRH